MLASRFTDDAVPGAALMVVREPGRRLAVHVIHANLTELVTSLWPFHYHSLCFLYAKGNVLISASVKIPQFAIALR